MDRDLADRQHDHDKIVTELGEQLQSRPVWQSVNRIESRVADQMQRDAILALIVSMLFIVIYIWFRFQKVAYGLAAFWRWSMTS